MHWELLSGNCSRRANLADCIEGSNEAQSHEDEDHQGDEQIDHCA